MSRTAIIASMHIPHLTILPREQVYDLCDHAAQAASSAHAAWRAAIVTEMRLLATDRTPWAAMRLANALDAAGASPGLVKQIDALVQECAGIRPRRV